MSISETAAASQKYAMQPHPLLRTGPAFALLVLLSFALNWPYLTSGFQGEDYIFVSMYREDPLAYSRLLGLWAESDCPALTTIWWFEGHGGPVFWRPIPSLLIEGSVRLFGERAFPLHVLSILIHGLVGGTLFLFVRRVTGHPIVALLAALFFLTCEDHTMGVGWISTVTDLVCVLFVNLALLTHLAWLEKRKARSLIGSLTCLALAMLSKESGAVAPLAIVLLTLAMPSGREIEFPGLHSLLARLKGSLGDWLSWVPAAAILLVYIAVYKLVGFGGFTSGMYVDPLANPGRYLAHLITHLPVMWLATLSPVPPSLTMFWSVTILPLAVAGAVVFIMWVVGLWWFRKSALAAWAMVVYILALLPQMATDASERGLYFPAIASSILLALVLVEIGPIARRLAPGAPSAPRITRIVGWGALVCVLVPGILLSAAMPYAYAPSFKKPTIQAASILPHVEERDPDHVLVLNTPGMLHTIYLQPIVAFHASPGLDVRVLSSMNGVMSVERVDDRSFIIRAEDAGWLTNMFARILRSPKPPKPGRTFENDLFKATFAEMTPDGRDVLAVRFELNCPLDDPAMLFIQWDGQTFRPIDLAALPPNEAVTLADTSNVWASMW
ncbi:MAG: glycosyltransferase family 39 protein [Phycisphaerales bacterium]|nr:MAG: glycosyltransferase family 39 protein [Phycisphaerales bacterium]